MTESLRKELLAAIKNGATIYRVATDAKINWHCVKRFAEGGGLRADQLDRLATYLGMSLRKD